ncbi:hypothetical protein E1162_19205 [Rhodobacteraceae bacterium RKSG542]|uniref:hypothetical protein n=1 Tax=Pseudovibrio flavus TaxID=2529854 RepID=UPI0012BD0B0E|nr:hypothetical protein [Pseudovibrio flavus]MTI19375.1 hypothetical protein [Pseudovibrio flavus]
MTANTIDEGFSSIASVLKSDRSQSAVTHTLKRCTSLYTLMSTLLQQQGDANTATSYSYGAQELLRRTLSATAMQPQDEVVQDIIAMSKEYRADMRQAMIGMGDQLSELVVSDLKTCGGILAQALPQS